MRGGGTNVDVAVRDGAHRVDELLVGGALHEITGRARLQCLGEIFLFRMHREDEHARMSARLP